MPVFLIRMAGGVLPVQMLDLKDPAPVTNVLSPDFGYVAIVDAGTLGTAELMTFKTARCTVSLCLMQKFASLTEFAFEADEKSGLPPLNLRGVLSALVQRIIDQVDVSAIVKVGLPMHILAVDYRAAQVVASRQGLMSERMARAWAKHAKRQLQSIHLFDVDAFLQDLGRTVDALPVPLPDNLRAARSTLRMPSSTATNGAEMMAAWDSVQAVVHVQV